MSENEESQNSNQSLNAEPYATVRKTKSNKSLIWIIILIIFIVFLFIFSSIFAILTSNSQKIISGITIHGIDVSGLTIDTATKKLENSLLQNTDYNLVYKDYTNTISSKDIEFNYDIRKSVEEAYMIGRANNLFVNNFKILSTTLNHKELDLTYTYDSERLDFLLDNIALELPDRVVNPIYDLEEKSLIITPGKSGIEMNRDELKSQLLNAIDSNESTINIPVTQVEPPKINIEKVYSKVHTEPQDAYIERDPFKLHLDVDGVDFAISLDEAKEMIKEEKDVYEIPVKITKAKVQVKDLGDAIFADTLATYSTRYDVSSKNRAANVELATRKINGAILLPGETFSYCNAVGKITLDEGYKESTVYTSSGIQTGVGGGVCQVSSTLYNSVLESNLQVVERKNHSYTVSYVPLGRDATVSSGSVDFKFKNNRTFPIKIIASAKNGVCQISIVGLKEDTDYAVSIQTKTLQTIPFTTSHVNDDSLAAGVTSVKQNGAYGYKSETYKILSKNGTIVSQSLISTDTYKPLTKIVRVGTQASAPVDTPLETPTQPTDAPVETPAQPTDVPVVTPTPEPAPIPNNDNSSVTVIMGTPEQ